MLFGVVRDVSFRAGAYDHVVETADGQRLVGVRSTTRNSRGANVAIAVDPSGCLAFPLEAELGAELRLKSAIAPVPPALEATASGPVAFGPSMEAPL